VPYVVLKELLHLSLRKKNVKDVCLQALSWIESIFVKNDSALMNESGLYIQNAKGKFLANFGMKQKRELYEHHPIGTVDDEILENCRLYQSNQRQQNKGLSDIPRVSLITQDRSLRLKARASNIAAYDFDFIQSQICV